MLHDELYRIAEPMLEKVKAHPFWSGLREGTLPPTALLHYAEQDAWHLLPAYGRAMARCAANARSDRHAALLVAAANGSLDAATDMADRLGKLAEWLGHPRPDDSAAPVNPYTHAHTSFMVSASTDSLGAGVVGLLPMSWFHRYVAADLTERHQPGSRYADWIADYDPGAEFHGFIDMYLSMVDELGAQASEAELARMKESFLLGARYEWMFAEGCLREAGWPL
jgi:thiaminase